MVTQLTKLVCILVTIISPWRWPEYQSKHVGGNAVNKLHYKFWRAFVGYLHILIIIFNFSFIVSEKENIRNQGGSTHNRTATISSFITGIEVIELRTLRWTEPVTSMRATQVHTTLVELPEWKKHHRPERKDNAERSATTSVGGFGWVKLNQNKIQTR